MVENGKSKWKSLLKKIQRIQKIKWKVLFNNLIDIAEYNFSFQNFHNWKKNISLFVCNGFLIKLGNTLVLNPGK